MTNYRKSLSSIESHIIEQENKIRGLVEKNSDMIRALAQIKNDLTKHLDNPEKLREVVIGAINICRPLTPYSSDYGLTNTIDPPMDNS